MGEPNLHWYLANLVLRDIGPHQRWTLNCYEGGGGALSVIELFSRAYGN